MSLRLIAPQAVEKLIFDSLTEVKGAAKTKKTISSAYR